MYLSPETILFIREHRNDDVHSLALQAKRYPQVDMPLAIVQIAGWQATVSKIPSWHATEGLLYPRHLSLEQCSSEVTALYKASLVHGEGLVDLTGGFGIDCAFLATQFKTVTYIERQEELCELAMHNFPLLGLKHIRVQNGDGVEYLQQMPAVDCIFLDPARRNEHGGKTVAISDCEPNVATLEKLLLEKGKQVMIKLSPMLDLSLAIRDMQHVSEAHIVSVNNECKELLLLLRPGDDSPEIPSAMSQPIVCINFANQEIQRFVFTRESEQATECSYTHEIGTYLYEPNASILKAGYDFLNDYDDVFGEFGEVVGFEYLRGMHLNDSKKELGSRVDRHDSIGKGLIGFAFFEKLMKDPRFDNMPLILETIDETLWPEEIAWLREQTQ